MHVFLEILELLGLWSLGVFTGYNHLRHKIRKTQQRNAQYKVMTNSLYGKKPANVQVQEQDSTSKYPSSFRPDYIAEFERRPDSS